MKRMTSIMLVVFASLSGSSQHVCSMVESRLDVLFQSKCTILIQDYFHLLNEMGDSSATFMDKMKISQPQRTALFMSDSSVIFDDLYSYETKAQYFNLNDYLMTIPSWYPHGVHFELLETSFLPCQLHQSNSWITIEMALQRSLEGIDYLGKQQHDTITLMASIVFQVVEEGGKLQINEPKILSVLPFESTAELASLPHSGEHTESVEVIQVPWELLPHLADSEKLTCSTDKQIPAFDRDANLVAARKSLMETKLHVRARSPKKIKKAWEL